MKTVVLFLGIFLATRAEKENDSKDLRSIPLCASLNNVYKTFANIGEVYNEFKTTGQLWTPVATGACPVTQLDCKTLSPVCAVTQGNFFKTFPNQCVLEAEQKATGTVWTIVFNGICSTNPADGFAAPAPQPPNNGKNDQYGGRYQPPPLNSIALTLGDTLASPDLSPSVPSYLPAPANYDSAPAVQQDKEKNPEPPQPCKQYNGDGESRPSPAYPAPPFMPYNYDQPAPQLQPATADPSKNSVPSTTYSNSMPYAAPPKAEQGPSIEKEGTNSNQLPKPEQPKEASNSLPLYYVPSYSVSKYQNSPQNSPNYPLSPPLPSSYNKNSVQDKPIGNARQPLHTKILIPAQKKPQQNPVSSNAYDTAPVFGRYNIDEKPKSSPVPSNYAKVSSSPSNDAAPSPAVPVSVRYTIPPYPTNSKSSPACNALVPSPKSAPISSIPSQYSASEQPVQSPSPLYALPSSDGVPPGFSSDYKWVQDPKPTESVPPPPPMAASYNPTYKQSQPHAYPSPYSGAVPPAILPIDYNSIQDSKPSPPTPTPSKCDQALPQIVEDTLTPNVSPSDSQKSPASPGYSVPSPGYSAASPIQPDYGQNSLQYQSQQAIPPPGNDNSAQAAQPSLNYPAPPYLSSYYGQGSPQLYPKQVQLPSPIYVPNYAAGPYSSVPEKMPSYNATSPDTSANNNPVQQSQTTPNCSAMSSSYDPGSAQVKSKENPPQPDSGLYIVVQEPKPSPKYPAPSPLPANYGQDYAQGQPKVASVASSQDSGSYRPAPEAAPSPKYPIPSPVPGESGQNSAKVQNENGAYAPSSNSGDYSSTQEQPSLTKYSAPPAVPSNYERVPVPDQPKEAAAPSPGSPNYGVSAIRPPPKYSATPDAYSMQPQGEPNQSTSCKDSQSPSSEAVQEGVPSSNPTLSNYYSIPKPQSYPKYPPSDSSQSQPSQPSQDAPLLPLYGNYKSEQKPPEQSQPYPVPYPILGSYGKISTQVQAEQSSLPSQSSSSYDAVQEIYPSPAYSASSYPAPSAVADGSSDQNSAQAPSSSQQGYECPLSSLSPSPVSAEKSVGNSYPGPSPNSYVQPYANENPEALYSPPKTENYQQSSNSYLPSPEQSSPASSEQSAPNDIPYSNTQTYNLPPQPQDSSNSISVTSDDAINSYAKEPESNSSPKKPEDYADASKSSQNGQDEAQTIYNGAVYQGPYYYEPKYKHINFGNFNFLPPQSPPLPVPAPSMDPPAEPVNPSAQYAEYNVNPFELLLKQLQYIAAKNGESSY